MGAVPVTDRLIPLPHEVEVAGFRTVRAAEVRVACDPGEDAPDPRVATALGLLQEIGLRAGSGTGAFRIELRIVGSDGRVPEALRGTAARLRALPNAEQAYAMVPSGEGGASFDGLRLLANGPMGLLHAARTLCQAVRQRGGEVEIPHMTVLDWPDIGERGQWGGNTHDEVAWMARWKLNVIEESVGLSVNADGKTSRALEQRHISEAHELGIAIVPYILHLEQVALYAGLMSRADLTSTPDPSKPLPGEYVPGLCMSSPATVRLVGDWMELIAGYEHIGAIEVWLSEDRSACFCDRCSGKEPFELEVRCIQEAFRRARVQKPGLALRILLTQGSYPVNDRVIAVADPDLQISYYDGGRTYDSSHGPMIYPLLQEYAASGRWLGVYPQITHCWRTVFPFTAPQLLAFRAQEFAGKGLANVIGYAVPSNRHHEHNVMALAEWTWNANGRSPEEFARAYATVSGMASPARFARWAAKAGEAGWWLAESRMLLRLIYNYDPDVPAGDGRTEDHRFRNAGVLYERARIEGALLAASEARALAAELGQPAAADESDAVHAGLSALLCLDGLLGQADPGAAPLLDRLDRAAAVLCRSVSRWGERVNALLPATSAAAGSMWVRLRDTANVLFRVSDTLRRKPTFRGVPDAYARYRLAGLGQWGAADFGDELRARFSFDVTARLGTEADHCFACFTYESGHYAAEIRSVSLRRRGPDGGEAVVSETGDGRMRVGRWEKWHELKLDLDRASLVPGSAYVLDVEIAAVILDGLRREGWECRGEIGFRLGWPAGTSIES